MSERIKQVMYVPASYAAGRHVAPGQRWEVSAIEGDTGEVELAEAVTTERVEFIRRVAIALWPHAPNGVGAADTWMSARWLWNEKPEDC